MISERLETVPVLEVAKALGIAPMKVKSAIINGTMPIGCVCRGDGEKSVDRTIILRTRWERWKAGDL